MLHKGPGQFIVHVSLDRATPHNPQFHGRASGSRADHSNARMNDLFASAGIASAAATARRAIAAQVRRRRGRPAPPAGAGQAAGSGVCIGQAAFDDPVGAAGRGQDDAGTPDGRCLQRRFHRHFGRPGRGQGDSRRGGARGGDAGAVRTRDHPVRRRSASIQQGAAGRVPALRRAGRADIHRRDHRESVVRSEWSVAVARGRLRAGTVVAGRPRRFCSIVRPMSRCPASRSPRRHATR